MVSPIWQAFMCSKVDRSSSFGLRVGGWLRTWNSRPCCHVTGTGGNLPFFYFLPQSRSANLNFYLVEINSGATIT